MSQIYNLHALAADTHLFFGRLRSAAEEDPERFGTLWPPRVPLFVLAQENEALRPTVEPVIRAWLEYGFEHRLYAADQEFLSEYAGSNMGVRAFYFCLRVRTPNV